MSSSNSIQPLSPAASVERIVSQSPGGRSSDSRAYANIKSAKDLQQATKQGQIVPVSEKELINAIERAIQAMQGANTTLNFSVHEKTKQIMVQVKDSDTGEIIREIPPEKALDFLAKVWEMAGILIDERR